MWEARDLRVLVELWLVLLMGGGGRGREGSQYVNTHVATCKFSSSEGL